MKILILSRGWQQLPAILQAKNLDQQVIVADDLENVRTQRESECRKDIQREILRLGEYMNPPFSVRKPYGWDPSAYARKLIENAVIIIAHDEAGHIIGLIAAYLNRQEEAFISMLVVEPAYRRCRIAEVLCRCVQKIAENRGILRIRGEIREDNIACWSLVQKLGYRRAAEAERGSASPLFLPSKAVVYKDVLRS